LGDPGGYLKMPNNPVQTNKQQRSDEFEYSTIDGEQNAMPMYELSSAELNNKTGGKNTRHNTEEYENANEVITDEYQPPYENLGKLAQRSTHTCETEKYRNMLVTFR